MWARIPKFANFLENDSIMMMMMMMIIIIIID